MNDRAKAVADAANDLQKAILEAEAAGLLVTADVSTMTIDSVVLSEGAGYRQTRTTIDVRVTEVIARGGGGY